MGTTRYLLCDGLYWLGDEMRFCVYHVGQAISCELGCECVLSRMCIITGCTIFTMDLINTDPPAEDLLKILLYDSGMVRLCLSLALSKVDNWRRA